METQLHYAGVKATLGDTEQIEATLARRACNLQSQWSLSGHKLLKFYSRKGLDNNALGKSRKAPQIKLSLRNCTDFGCLLAFVAIVAALIGPVIMGHGYGPV